MEKINLRELATSLIAWQTCKKTGNPEWESKHKANMDTMLELLSSGSGLDDMNFDFENSLPDKLIFHTTFHHMKDGYYTQWTEHKLILSPSFVNGYHMKITGVNHDNIKEYLTDVFSNIFLFENKN